jgi:hypothetical protein
MTLTKNEEQILALERRANSFSWTDNEGRVFSARSVSPPLQLEINVRTESLLRDFSSRKHSKEQASFHD